MDAQAIRPLGTHSVNYVVRWAASLAAALMFAQLNCQAGIAGGIVVCLCKHKAWTAAVPAALIPSSIHTVTALTADILITTSLCVILSKQMDGFKRTKTLILRLIMHSINRGIFILAFQVAHFILVRPASINRLGLIDIDIGQYMITKHEDVLYWMLTHTAGTSVYVNLLLAVLNIRKQLREDALMPDSAGAELPLHDIVSRDAILHAPSGLE
ncbi:uncharacterized protein LAESUDRAFT_755782 [Laetiporus sulphureus 93-53]|uniref:DUF6534 domain-containing protein n=1 Tax=Laetiporus sulphureus 93-53 TaxID=1314785 RepID=A0A165GFH3_9APHY|nr:uncharacterized protein LAESUDRAFT_755782 [Laetiporus sulphureus 93-53]KZT10276.1 hypothetical protein LAESUDRAFT_755782 [Laetiporus sulphureus 93-53]